jgi:hypothetical protein
MILLFFFFCYQIVISDSLYLRCTPQIPKSLSLQNIISIMGFLDKFKKTKEKSTDSENRSAEQEEMRDEQHELDLKENYESDENYEESKD